MENPRKNLAAHFFKISAHPGTGGSWMAAAAEFAANLVHVHTVIFRSHAEANSTLRQLLKKYRDHDRVDGANIIDQAVDIIGVNSQWLLDFVRQRHAGVPVVCFYTGLRRKSPKEVDYPPRVAFLPLVAKGCGVDPDLQELRRNFEGASGDVSVPERTGIRGDSGVKSAGRRQGERQILCPEKFVHDLTGGWRPGVDINQIAISRIAGVMVDVDPLFRTPNRSQSGP